MLLAGTTTSSDLPLLNALQGPGSVSSSLPAAFAAKLNSDASALVYSTYLGTSEPGAPNGSTIAFGIAVDSSGNAYITGSTDSPAFPLLASLHNVPARSDCFVTKLDPAGELLFSTLFGSGADDACLAITLDNQNRIVVAGHTAGPHFPLVDPLQTVAGSPRNGFIS
jgi:hypothetical protein